MSRNRLSSGRFVGHGSFRFGSGSGGGSRVHRGSGDDLSRRFSRLSVGGEHSTRSISIPSIPDYAFGGEAVAGASVEIGEIVPAPKPIPENYSSTREYLKEMQAHTQQEFYQSILQGVSEAERLEDSGWLPVTCRQDPTRNNEGLSFFVDGAPSKGTTSPKHDFKTDPWARHAVQFEGCPVPGLVIVCADGASDHSAFLVVASAEGFKDSGRVPLRHPDLHTRVRSLGYVGPFFKEYGSAADLLTGRCGSEILSDVASPGEMDAGAQKGGDRETFVPAGSYTIDTSSVPLNETQRDAVINLTGGLDIIVGPPGTGKSTTIWHVVNSRVAPGSQVLITCTRNQAIDAVVRKVESFGVLVFGNETRVGDYAKNFSIAGRMLHDPELVFWRNIVRAWSKAHANAKAVSWTALHLPAFPGIQRLRELQADGDAACNEYGKFKAIQAREKAGRAAGRWIRVLSQVLRQVYMARLQHGTKIQRLTFKQLQALKKWKKVLKIGLLRAQEILARLEILTQFRILSKTQVLLCTVDSTERMVREMEEGTKQAAEALMGRTATAPVVSARLSVDTVIMDEAACVLETALPVILALGTKNLILVGDHRQLKPFTRVRDEDGGNTNHSRSLLERAVDAGVPSQFLDVQYRMHPRICEVISATFYRGMLDTAPDTIHSRTASNPCKWVHVSGGERKHQGRGYSNEKEVPIVMAEAREAMRRYGQDADVRVITFYNMQRRHLEREINNHLDLANVRITSVDSCQGSDADVVIISTVRSGGPGYQLSGFMMDACRVNVALSRAREECIVVGDKHTMREGGGAMWRSVISHYTSS